MLLLPGGLAAAHAVGYRAAALAGTGAGPTAGDHGFVGELGLLAIPITLAVLVRAFVAGLRGELPPVRLRSLVAQQVCLYLAVELVEHATAGIHPLAALAEAALLVGVLVHLAVAVGFWLLVWLLQRLGRAVAATASVPDHGPSERRPWVIVSNLDIRLPIDVGSVSRRGPPTGLVPV